MVSVHLFGSHTDAPDIGKSQLTSLGVDRYLRTVYLFHKNLVLNFIPQEPLPHTEHTVQLILRAGS